MVATHAEPARPGEILDKEFLRPLKMTQAELAEKMGVSVQTINLLVNGKRSVTAETAILLARVSGTTPQVWLNLQMAHDLWAAHRKLKAEGRLR